MAITLTQRDIQILETLYTARYLTTQQIQALFWRPLQGGTWGPVKACERRMRLLYTNGLVRRIEQPVKRGEGPQPYIYALDRRGADILVVERGIEPHDIDWKPKSAEENYPFLRHLLATNDVRIALTLACEGHGVELVSWLDEKELKSEGMKDYVTITTPEGKRQQTPVIPDAAFLLRWEKKRALFFVEIDCGTVTVAPSRWETRGWSRKVQAYLAYADSEAYRRRYGERRARILTVTTSQLRLAHLKATTETTGGGNQFWFTTFELATNQANLLTAPIWSVAGRDEPAALLG
jgi:hypothetical protein